MLDHVNVIEVERLHKRYGDRVAVDDISFTVERGQIFEIVGPNGAGKTTSVECIEGLRRPGDRRAGRAFHRPRPCRPARHVAPEGYLLKDSPPAELVRAVRAAYKGEAAATLFVGEATIKTHLLHIYAKLGVRDRASAVGEAFRRGLLA